jgi:electron-transferring-flavoprotein dehydrogenase
MYEKIMEKCGWPAIQYDGELLVSHQDALLLGGKVQGAPNYRDHILFNDPEICRQCRYKSCVEICSGQAITRVENKDLPVFDHEKCLHCGACLWGCAKPGDGDKVIDTNIRFTAAPGGLHSAEN